MGFGSRKAYGFGCTLGGMPNLIDRLLLAGYLRVPEVNIKKTAIYFIR